MESKRLAVPLDIKAQAGNVFEGFGSVFGNVDLGGDIVVPGAFKSSIQEHKRRGTSPMLLWQHQVDRVAGRWTDFREEPAGLYVKGELADTELGREVKTLLKMGAVSGLSIGYATKVADYDQDGNRLIKQADLFEISVVSFPMNPAATVTTTPKSIRDYENVCRDALGMSRRDARRFAAKTFDVYRKACDERGVTESLNDELELAVVAQLIRAAASKIRNS